MWIKTSGELLYNDDGNCLTSYIVWLAFQTSTENEENLAIRYLRTLQDTLGCYGIFISWDSEMSTGNYMLNHNKCENKEINLKIKNNSAIYYFPFNQYSIYNSYHNF